MNRSVRFKIMTCEEGIESALIKGQADFGFDCGRPHDPAVAFKQIIEEEIITVASPKYLRQHKIKNAGDLTEKEFVYYSRLRPVRNLDVSKAHLASNDIAVIRSLVLNHYGWATLPFYAVKDELEANKLSAVNSGEIKGFKFGVWWLRGRESLLPWVKEAEGWLSQQDLSSGP